MVSRTRWEKAQAYERSYWESRAAQIQSEESGDLSWYGWRAERLHEIVGQAVPELGPSLASARILEVGSGPVGIASFLRAGERVAVDPLCDYYSTQPALIRHRSPDVRYQSVRGEELPFPDAHFDLVILDNVIDHVRNADGVMREIRRVLGEKGVLFFTVNLHPLWGSLLHRMLSKTGVDKGHPHTFTLDGARDLLRQHGFGIRHEEWQDYGEAKRADLSSASAKDRLKGLLGLSEFLYTSVAQRAG